MCRVAGEGNMARGGAEIMGEKRTGSFGEPWGNCAWWCPGGWFSAHLDHFLSRLMLAVLHSPTNYCFDKQALEPLFPGLTKSE